MTDEPRRATRRRAEPLPEPELPPNTAPDPELTLRPRELKPEHMAVVDTWFVNGCLSKRQAALDHGYKNHSQLFTRPDVKAYIRECMAKRQEYMAMSEADIIRRLEQIASADFGDLLEVNPDGTAWIDMANLTPDLRAAISEYRVEAYTETDYGEDGPVSRPVKKFRVKLHDKKAALDSLARIHGMNKDKMEVATSQNLVDQIAAARKRLNQQEPET